ncbi:MAG: PAS domain S-box protein [Nevskia sp.]|nr:PAS domain S-box protein [Nevskia sp.]
MPGKVLVAIAELGGEILSLNHHCEAAIGLSSSAALGQLVWTLLPTAEFVETMRDGCRAAADGKDVADHSGKWQTNHGARFAVDWGYHGIRGASGTMGAIVVTGYDLGAVRRVQGEAREMLDRYQSILDTAVDGILTIGEDGLIKSFNRAAERIFGYRAVEVLGRNVSMLMPQPYRAEHDDYLHNYLNSRRKKIIGLGREVEGLRKDGTVFPLELSVGEVTVSGGHVFTGIIRDITDRKQVESEARRHQDDLAHLARVHSMGDLAAGLAHEINQPLTAILGHARAWVRMLDAGNPDLISLRDSMEKIAHQGERAAEVIRRLRKYVERGEMERQPSDLSASVSEALDLLQHELKVEGVHVMVKSPAGQPEILIDRVQIEQVLVNLVRNAIQAMTEAHIPSPELELVTVVTETPCGVCVSVRDNGPGFGATAPDQLFAPFFTTKQDGLGQGLSSCRRIVDAHGGRIWAEPNRPRGAVFSLWLPLSQAQGGGGLREVTRLGA